MRDELFALLKTHVPNVEKCDFLVEKLTDLIEDDREVEVGQALDEGYDEGHDEGYAKGHAEGYTDGYDDGYGDTEDA